MAISIKALIAGAALAITAGATAHANPVFLGYSTDGGATINTLATGNGATLANQTVGNFSILATVSGQAAGNPTSLFSNTLTISSSGGGSIIIYASETNNTFPSAFFTTGFGNNSSSTVTVVESSYLGLSNSTYSTTQPYALSSMSVAPGAPNSNQTVAAPSNLPATYSLTEAYAVTFAAGGGNLNATLGVTSTVPEPMSLALLGTGLVGLGIARRKRA